VHNQEHKVDISKQKVLEKDDAWCSPWSKEGERLVLAKLGVPSKSAVLEPMRYDARVLMIEVKVA
jgi:hypothetical protein